MSDIQDLIHKITMDSMISGAKCERERIIRLLENWDREEIWIETAIEMIKGEFSE